MKIISLNGNLPNYNYGLNKLNKIIYETLSELGVDVEEFNLALTDIPYYNGLKSENISHIINEIKKSDGVIFTTETSLYSTGAPLQVFAEHLEDISYGNVLKDKNCLVALVFKNNSSQIALNYYSQMINGLGGFESIKISVRHEYLKNEEIDKNIKNIIEKQVEDYYRIVRQNRRFLIPDYYIFDNNFAETLEETNLAKFQTISPKSYKNLEIDKFNSMQKKDIDEITQFFANKYTITKNEDNKMEINKKINNIFKEDLTRENFDIIPRIKTCKQQTSNLTHRFQPQLAIGLEEIIQLDISGNENFTGIIAIENGECSYLDGASENPDINIITDDKTWSDVLNGKITAQKAFMSGKIKVRGNFVLLSKFEQIFNIARL